MHLLLRKPIWHKRILRRVLGPLRTLKHSLRITALVSVLLCLFSFNPIFSSTKPPGIFQLRISFTIRMRSLWLICARRTTKEQQLRVVNVDIASGPKASTPDLVKDKVSLQCKAWMFTQSPSHSLVIFCRELWGEEGLMKT